MSMFDYPLNLRFKLIALAPRIIVTNNKGREVLFVSQKVLNLREDIRIYNNEQREREIYQIHAEQILDFNTRYNFFLSDTQEHIGSVKAKGWRSLWSATYLIDDPRQDQMMFIKEDNPWVKIAELILEQNSRYRHVFRLLLASIVYRFSQRQPSRSVAAGDANHQRAGVLRKRLQHQLAGSRNGTRRRSQRLAQLHAHGAIHAPPRLGTVQAPFRERPRNFRQISFLQVSIRSFSEV